MKDDFFFVKGLSVTKIFSFCAAHHLPRYEGKCKNVHGHSWILWVTVKLKPDCKGEKEGMIVDFSDLKRIVEKQVIEALDHTDLNKVIEYPTAENILYWIKDRLDFFLNIKSYRITRLRLYESETSFAEWEE